MPMDPNARPIRGGERETKIEMYGVRLYLKDNVLKNITPHRKRNDGRDFIILKLIF